MGNDHNALRGAAEAWCDRSEGGRLSAFLVMLGKRRIIEDEHLVRIRTPYPEEREADTVASRGMRRLCNREELL